VRPEYTPVEIDTSVTDQPKQGGRDRVWSLKQEAPRLQLRSSSQGKGAFYFFRSIRIYPLLVNYLALTDGVSGEKR